MLIIACYLIKLPRIWCLVCFIDCVVDAWFFQQEVKEKFVWFIPWHGFSKHHIVTKIAGVLNHQFCGCKVYSVPFLYVVWLFSSLLIFCTINSILLYIECLVIGFKWGKETMEIVSSMSKVICLLMHV